MILVNIFWIHLKSCQNNYLICHFISMKSYCFIWFLVRSRMLGREQLPLIWRNSSCCPHIHQYCKFLVCKFLPGCFQLVRLHRLRPGVEEVGEESKKSLGSWSPWSRDTQCREIRCRYSDIRWSSKYRSSFRGRFYQGTRPRGSSHLGRSTA